MTNTTTLKNESLDKKLKDNAFMAFIAIVAISWAGYIGDGTSNMLLGSILIGLNLVRRSYGIEMSKSSYLIGAFLFSMVALAGATLYNPIWLPLGGMMLAALAIYNGLQK